MNEFSLIDRIRSIMGAQAQTPKEVLGIGDDCAVIPFNKEEDLLVSTDILVEGTHFRLETAQAEDIGWKAACVNISDIAAMGGTPKYIFLTLALPDEGHFKEGRDYWVEKFTSGLKAACKKYNVTLLGGDISSSLQVVVNITVHGVCPHGKAVLRSGACVGNNICVSGTLGGSALGLSVLENNVPQEATSDTEYLRQRHLRPTPRVELGKELAKRGVHAMMDVSDGVAGDLKHILKASGEQLGAEIYLEKIPLAPEVRNALAGNELPAAFALCSGEEYELLFTADPSTPLPAECTVIGKVTDTRTVTYFLNGEKKNLPCLDGYKHF